MSILPRTLFILLFIAALLLLLQSFSNNSHAYAAEPLRIEAETSSRFIRLRFYCKQPVEFSTSVSDNAVSVHFNKSFQTNTAAVTQASRQHITRTSLSADGKTIIFQLKPGKYRTRKFISDRFIGIDILGLNDASPQKETATVSATEPPKKTVKEVAKPAPAPKKEPKNTKKTSPTSPSTAVKPKPVPVVGSAKTVQAVPVPKVEAKAAEALPPVQEKEEEPKEHVELSAGLSPYGQKWVFGWKKDVAAAVFYRAGYLWIIFDQWEPIDLSPLLKDAKYLVSKAEQIPNTNYTILRFKGQSLSRAKVYKEDYRWVVDIHGSAAPEPAPARIISEYYSPASKGTFFPVQTTSNLVLLLDPEVGDKITVLPLYEAGTGVSPARMFPDFQLLSTAQGMAFVLMGDQVKATKLSTGIELLSPVKSLLPPEESEKPKATEPSSENPATESGEVEKKKLATQPVPPASEPAKKAHPVILKKKTYDAKGTALFPFERWREERDPDFLQTQQDLEQQLSLLSPAERIPRYMEMARFLFAHGLHAESQGILSLLTMTQPSAAFQNPVKILNAANYFLVNNYLAASKTFESVDMDALSKEDRREIKFWQEASIAGLRTSNNELDFMANRELFVKNYPLPLQYRFAFLDADSRLSRKDIAGAEKILGYLEEDMKGRTVSPLLTNELHFLQGGLAAEKKELQKAIDLWTPLVQNPLDQKNRLKAGLSIVKLSLGQRAITPADAIKNLNSLRMTWRGGEEEAELLKTLAELYMSQKNYVEALRTWKQIVTYFSNTGDSLYIAARMSKLFITLFAEDGVDKMSDFKTVSLYYEFRELTPIGREGDIIIQQLAKRLMKLDLLDRAAALLTHQVRYRLHEEERSNAAANLALIQLLNRKPDLALEALNMTGEEPANDELKQKRKYLKVKALGDLKQFDQGVALLKGDKSKEADALRLHIAWKKKDWSSLRDILSPQVDQFANRTDMLTEEQAKMVIHNTIATAMLHDKEDLTHLREMFEKRFAPASPLKDIFTFMTTDKGPIDYQDLDQSAEIGLFENFLNQYRKAFESEKALAAKPKETPAAGAAPAQGPAPAENAPPPAPPSPTSQPPASNSATTAPSP